MLCFVYGTLTDRATATDVLSTFEYRGRARLSGLRRVDGKYPTLVPGDGVTGRLLQTPDSDSLDRYEGVAGELYVRVAVPLADDVAVRNQETAEIYVGNPDRLGLGERWPGDGTFEQRVQRYLDEHAVVVSSVA